MQLMEEKTLRLHGATASKNAFIYNGLEDVELKYVGQTWKIPFDQVTEIGPYRWKEIDQMKSNGMNIVMELLEVEGEIVATELVTKHAWEEKGVVVFLPGKTPTEIEEIKTKAKEQARLYKLGQIEQFRRDRELARSGKSGFKLYPNDNVRRWMKELDINDEIFNPLDIAGDTESRIQQAVAAAVKPFADMFERMMDRETRMVERMKAKGEFRRRGSMEKEEDYQRKKDEFYSNLEKEISKATE